MITGRQEIAADNPVFSGQDSRMSLAEVLAELPALSVGERQQLIRSAMELDDDGLSEADRIVVEGRLAKHLEDPGSNLRLDEMKARLNARFQA